MRILLTNDDGIDAEGLQCLFDVLSEKAECFVVAPDQGRSCCSHGVTTGSPLQIASRTENQWAVTGTPADCVRLGLIWLDLKPDLVVSGVNHGGNLGVDILYSGTAAGAREACSLGVPSIAISQYMRRDVARDWKVNAKRAQFVLENILEINRPGSGFWNVNLPALPLELVDLRFPVTVCEPETQPLSYSFDDVTELAENDPQTVENDAQQRIRSVLYKSNYQARPRHLGSDVDLCFSGHATASFLRAEHFGVRI